MNTSTPAPSVPSVPSVPPSIRAYRTFQLSKQTLHHVSINLFTVPDSILDCFRSYYLKYWRGEYCIDRIEDGTIEDSGTRYLVVYSHCTPFQIRRCAQVKLSFRVASPEFNIPAYVLVKLT